VKTLIIMLAVFLCMPILLAQNPDERKSIELILHQEINEINIEGSVANYSPTGFKAKFTFPASDDVSVILGFGYSGSKIEFKDVTRNQEITGFCIDIGLKLYLSK